MLSLEYTIPLICKLSREKTFTNWREIRFSQRKTFTDCSVVPPMDATPPNFMKKTFPNSHKTSKFVKVFSLESFLLYGNDLRERSHQ